MIRQGMLAGLILAVAFTTARAEEKKGPLEGQWKLTKLESSQSDSEVQNGVMLTFSKDRAWLGEAEDKNKFKYKVDMTAKPPLLDVTTPDNKVIEGIWELKGDVLRLCIIPVENGGGRPTEFHGRDGQILLTLDRVKE